MYLARVGSDAKWRRPTEGTARAVWVMLKKHGLPYELLDLMPKQKLEGEEYDRAALTAKQSLVVALDCAITNGDSRTQRDGKFTRKRRFTKNDTAGVDAALASRAGPQLPQEGRSTRASI